MPDTDAERLPPIDHVGDELNGFLETKLVASEVPATQKFNETHVSAVIPPCVATV